MDIFQYFDDDNRRIEQQLREILRNGHLWPNQILFERISHVFSEIKLHCELQDSIVESIKKCDSTSSTVAACLSDSQSIAEQMDSLLMSHIDDDDFGPGLARLLTKMEHQLQISHGKLFNQAKETIPPEEIEKINSKILEKIFS